VDGLYYADSLAQLMLTEFNSYLWWDLRNGSDFDGDMDASLYGWRTYGDFGIVNGLGDVLTNRYPTYYTSKLMQYFARPGDNTLSASSDYSLVSAYSARRTNGAVTVLVINKDPTNTYTGQMAVAGYVPGSNAVVRSYGMPQDNATKNGTGSMDLATNNISGAGTNFSYSFAPYSVTVFTLAPTAPGLVVVNPRPAANKFVMQLQGQANVRYVMLSSTNLKSWNPVSTNTLASATLNFTNTISAGTPTQFWRAVWQP
jgi:hypothetical protein